MIPGAEPPASGPEGSGAPQARAVTDDGDVLVLVAASSPAARAAVRSRDDLGAVMEITDVAPVWVPHRIRGRACVAGWLAPVPDTGRAAGGRLLAQRCPTAPAADEGHRLLRLEVGEAWVDDLWGEGPVEPDEFAAATADPLTHHEAELLQHLAAAHGDEVRGLCALLDTERPGAGGGCGTGSRVAPLALDRFGLRVRFSGTGAQACSDARFDFPEPVRDVAELREAMHRLFEAAATR